MDDSGAFSSYSVTDLAAAKAFYEGTLCLAVEELPQGLGVNLSTGGSVFLYPKDDHQPASFTVLNFRVDDIEAAVDELTGSGVTMEHYDGFDQDDRGISSAGGGPRIAWFKDPAGNVLSVVQPT
ncbi:MAG TPA: VOC family protein [Acidimicrobiales bacterium]|nr:VOC family protein [Acidimicrobiales bacterium]